MKMNKKLMAVICFLSVVFGSFHVLDAARKRQSKLKPFRNFLKKLLGKKDVNSKKKLKDLSDELLTKCLSFLPLEDLFEVIAGSNKKIRDLVFEKKDGKLRLKDSFLIKYLGINPEFDSDKDNNGLTPLHWAAKKNNVNRSSSSY